MIDSGSDFTFSDSSGVDSLIEMRGGGGIFSTSSSEEPSTVLLLTLLVVLVFLLLPRGAGSRFNGVRLYMTVLVTTLLTLTGFEQALRGVVIDSNVRLDDQSAGEKGEYRALCAPDNAVRGEGPVAVVGEKIGE